MFVLFYITSVNSLRIEPYQ